MSIFVNQSNYDDAANVKAFQQLIKVLESNHAAKIRCLEFANFIVRLPSDSNKWSMLDVEKYLTKVVYDDDKLNALTLACLVNRIKVKN